MDRQIEPETVARGRRRRKLEYLPDDLLLTAAEAAAERGQGLDFLA